MTNYLFATRSHTDVVHTAIPYSGLENYILNTPLLIRLQRVSQNSLVYLTFATNKVKRFEHSLGVMHLAGMLFQSAVSNTKDEVLNEMLSLFEKELNDWINNREVKIAKKHIYSDKFFDDEDTNYKITDKKAPFVALYNAHTPPHIPQKWGMLYVSLYQGVRIAGLLHDVGHLPYSHTLEEVLKIIKSKWEKDSPKNSIQEEYLDIIDSYNKNKFDKLHEAITMKLFPIIEIECMRLIKNKFTELPENEMPSKQKNEYLLLCLYSFEIARRILSVDDNSESVIYNVLHRIISGTFDADRLDYVSRDLFCSGVSKDVINYERMFMFLSFNKNQDENLDIINADPYPLTIASKTVGDMEEFLRKRWKSYRDINYHHSVHRNELLMRSILINSAEEALKESGDHKKGRKKNEKNDLPDNFLDGILFVLKKLKEEVNEGKIADAFLRLDDSWLDTLIKKSTNRNGMVDELAFGRKNYQTIIKRFDDFFEFDGKIYDCFINIRKEKSKEVRQFIQLKKDLEEALVKFTDTDDKEKYYYKVDIFQNIFFIFLYEVEEHSEYVISYRNFLVNTIIDMLNYYLSFNEDISPPDEYPYATKFFTDLAVRLHDKYPNSKDGPLVMVDSLWFSDGIKEKDCNCMIRVKDDLKSFRTYSGLKFLLHAERLMLPAFHFYCKNEMDMKSTTEYLTETVFNLLKSDIIIYARELLNEMKKYFIKRGN